MSPNLQIMSATRKAVKPAPAVTKPDQIRLRLIEEDKQTLDDLNPGGVLKVVDVASVLLHAACQAIRENPEYVGFPPAFQVIRRVREDLKLNEKPK